MTNASLIKQLDNWYISYDPYTDIFQMYSDYAFKSDKSMFKKTALEKGYIYTEKRTNKPLFIEVPNAYDYIGDVDNMDKEHIIQKVIGYLQDYGKV